MHNLENFTYNKINLTKYYQTLKELFMNEELQQLNISYSNLGKTNYNYNIDCITIGNGDKEIFLVGGTHGSEIITTDFLLNFIKELPNKKDFNPSEVKLIIIPLQNPEGFDICTNTFNQFDENIFEEKSYEYFIKYKIDSLITSILKDLNNLNLRNEPYPLDEFYNFINNNEYWLYLTSLIPELKKFKYCINNLNNKYLNYNNFIITICNSFPKNNPYLNFVLLELKDFLLDNNPKSYINTNKRLYQNMFKNSTFDNLKNIKLKKDTIDIYQKYNHPKGSQINHDSTGLGINLNANNTLNPGINYIRKNQPIYGPGIKSNIRNYVPGPIGIPTLNINNFEYSIENIVLENLIKDSINRGKYQATFLFHGTGGLIYYKPHKELMNETKYQEFLNFNEELANIYHNDTTYKLLNESGSTGYGDYLRRTYQGVLLIELSKMGGNPIGPYGDKNNIYKVFNDNTNALTSVIKHLAKRR